MYVFGRIDGSNYYSSIFRWINDPCMLHQYNCSAVYRLGRCYIKTIGVIMEGDELFLPYGREYIPR